MSVTSGWAWGDATPEEYSEQARIARAPTTQKASERSKRSASQSSPVNGPVTTAETPLSISVQQVVGRNVAAQFIFGHGR
jgi:hypothetical protein